MIAGEEQTASARARWLERRGAPVDSMGDDAACPSRLSERQRRDAGLWYDANNDPDARAERLHARRLTHRLNALDPADEEGKRAVLAELFGAIGSDVELLPPFQCDCGYPISIGEGSFINYNAYFMDGAAITIGAHVYIGPNCGLYTAQHPLRWQDRNTGLERALPIVVEDNCWLGADVKVLAGVTIGAGSVIAAGSLVTRDIPSGVLAMGSPCRVVRPITEEDAVGR